MFDFFNSLVEIMSQIYNAITLPFKWSGYILDGVISVMTIPTTIQAFLPPVIMVSVYVVMSICIVRTVVSLLPF